MTFIDSASPAPRCDTIMTAQHRCEQQTSEFAKGFTSCLGQTLNLTFPYRDTRLKLLVYKTVID
jgi:hypothetical protein